MSDRQWPLSAPATRLLLSLPPAGAKPRRLTPDSEPIKLALKELLVRGAFTMEVEERRRGRDRVTLSAGKSPGSLPPPLARLDAALRPLLPGELKEVLKAARAHNPMLVKDVDSATRSELTQRRLIDEHDVKRFGLFPARAWSRTASGDAWATTGAEHRERLSTLDRDLRETPDAGAEAALAAGSMAVLVPAAMGPIALEHRRRQESGAAYAGGGGETGGDAGGGDFNVFQGVGDLFDSVLAGGMDSLDAGISAVDGALDSVAGSIDSAIDSGVDAGGGDFGGGGGDFGGGGGGDGGGGG